MLNNPIWSALSTRQQHLALGHTLARCFPGDIGPLAGLAQPTAEAYEALAQLKPQQERFILFLEEPAAPPERWVLELEGPLTQMVLERTDLLIGESAEMVTLTDADVPDMVALAKLTQPGPFKSRTNTLGRYVGIRVDGRLAAMAGERLHMEGYTEISAVCTHPDFQGRGYARVLMSSIAQGIFERGETPILHAWQHNTGAIRVYEKLGFVESRTLHVAVLRFAPALLTSG